MRLSGKPRDEVAKALDVLNPQFEELIASLNRVSQETARESNPIATCLTALFRAYLFSFENNKAAFLERYQIDFSDKATIKDARSCDLFIALTRVAKEYNLSFKMRSAQQFIQRFSNDLDVIREAGFEIVVDPSHAKAHRGATYTITYLD